MISNIIYRVFYYLLWPFARLCSERWCILWNICANAVYAAFLSHRFRSAVNLTLLGRPVRIFNGKNISLGRNCILGKDCRIEAVTQWRGQHFTPSIELGDNVVINTLCHIGCIGKVKIGDYTTLGARVYVTDHIHGETVYEQMVSGPRLRPLYSKGPVIIGDCVSIGENCVILPGVTIGHSSIIGANSVVTKDVPPFSVVGGIPGKVIRTVQPENNK